MPNNDFLTEDGLLPVNQKFCCISFLKDPKEESNLVGVKVRGVFLTLEEASDHAKQLQTTDPYHNVYVGECGKWLAFSPDINSKEAGDPVYANDKLNEIMISHNESQKNSELFHEHRKNKMVNESIQESINTSKNNKKELEDELNKVVDEDKQESINKKLETINEQIKTLEKKQKTYIKNQSKIESQLKEKNINI